MKKRALPLILAVFFALPLAAQNLVVFTGLSHAMMSDLKTYRDNYMASFGVNKKVLQDFPIYWRHGVMLNFDINERIRLGFMSSFTSTGTRMTYEDYSGKVGIDMTLRNISAGAHFEFRVVKQERSSVWLYKESGIILVLMDMNQYAAIGDGPPMNEHSRYQAVNAFDEFGVNYQWSLSSAFTLYTSLGIHVNVAGSLDNTTDGGYLQTYTYKDRVADWSGGKFNLGISWNLRKE